MEGTRMRVITHTPFGSGNHTEMVLEAPDRPVKNKWFYKLTGQEDKDTRSARNRRIKKRKRGEQKRFN
jgi:hypothetical protein